MMEEIAIVGSTLIIVILVEIAKTVYSSIKVVIENSHNDTDNYDLDA